MPPEPEHPTEVTLLLHRLQSGSPDVEGRLFELIYGELRRIAGARMQSERPDHTLSATALVHEAYLRLSGTDETFANRTHFLAVAARAMRHILVDHARARRAAKRGGAAEEFSLEGEDVAAPQSDEELLMLDDALARLAAMSPRQSRVIELRYFAGLTEEEVASVLGVTRRTVNRDWSMARAWLHGQLKPD
jgi:RNA polymerase sigma factor (TIGR02999 family)